MPIFYKVVSNKKTQQLELFFYPTE